MASVMLRLLLAAICGGIVGVEREYKRRSAGFRTHILICLGAAMTTMTSEFLFLNMNYYLDIARLGASVVAGIGFMGAGTIIVTRRKHVKGLTTAAGLWTSAIVGLALGAGFYEGGLLTTLLILLAELLFSKLEYRMLDNAPEINLYMEYNGRVCLEAVLRLCREMELKLLNLEIARHADGEKNTSTAILCLRLNKRVKVDYLLAQIHQIPDIVMVEEI
jgi:putative Mg2+ transporter-C (MgtC) family protein